MSIATTKDSVVPNGVFFSKVFAVYYFVYLTVHIGKGRFYPFLDLSLKKILIKGTGRSPHSPPPTPPLNTPMGRGGGRSLEVEFFYDLPKGSKKTYMYMFLKREMPETDDFAIKIGCEENIFLRFRTFRAFFIYFSDKK